MARRLHDQEPAVISTAARRLLRKMAGEHRLKQTSAGEWYLRRADGTRERVRAMTAIEDLVAQDCLAIHKKKATVTTFKLSQKGRRALVGA